MTRRKRPLPPLPEADGFVQVGGALWTYDQLQAACALSIQQMDLFPPWVIEQTMIRADREALIKAGVIDD